MSMKSIQLLRVLGTSALALTLAAAVPSSALARRSSTSATQAFQLFSREQLSQSLAPCKDQFPGGVPLSVESFARERKATGLCFDAFADVYSHQTKTPIVTVERLNRASIQDAQDEERTD